VGLLALLAGLGSGSAAAAGHKKLVEGTVYDTTCSTVTCGVECPPPPHCGPITADRGSAAIVCPLRERRIIACPLATSSKVVCVEPAICPNPAYPVYSGEGATITVRKRGSATVLATLPVIEGHFRIRLGLGEYVLHPYLPEPQCWSGVPIPLTVPARWKGPIPVSVSVANACVAHPDS
jgi:hypothetical protein